MLRKLYSLKQKIIECWHEKNSKEGIAVYMFHRVTHEICAEYENISISVDAFTKFIEGKLGQGRKFISIEKLQNYADCTSKSVIITFDDMFEDAYINAIPILRKYKIPYTVFVSPSLLGMPNYISREQLEALKKDNLCTIGAHSISHKILRNLSLKEKREEIAQHAHEQMLKCPIQYFAYPYGSYYACDRESQLLVKREYKLGFATISFFLTQKYMKRSPFFLPRINVNNKNCLKV